MMNEVDSELLNIRFEELFFFILDLKDYFSNYLNIDSWIFFYYWSMLIP